MNSRRGTMFSEDYFCGDQRTADFTPYARLLHGMLICSADAEGLFKYFPQQIRYQLNFDVQQRELLRGLPVACSDAEADAWIDAQWESVITQFEASGVAHLYSTDPVDTTPNYGWFPKFSSYNKLELSSSSSPLPPLLVGQTHDLDAGLVGAVARRDRHMCRLCQGRTNLVPGTVTLCSAIQFKPPYLREKWAGMHPERPRLLHLAHIGCAEKNLPLQFDPTISKPNTLSGFDPARTHYAVCPPSFEGVWRTIASPAAHLEVVA